MYYRTTFTFAVLSDEPLPEGADFASILDECDTGNYVADWQVGGQVTEKLTGKEMADALYNASSDPSFFNLDVAGNQVDDTDVWLA